MLDAGRPAEPGFMTGGCGDRATPYAECEVEHKDTCLGQDDRKRLFCLCVCRVRGTLVLPF